MEKALYVSPIAPAGPNLRRVGNGAVEIHSTDTAKCREIVGDSILKFIPVCALCPTGMSHLTKSTPGLQTRAELIGNLIFIDLLAMPGAPVLLLCPPKCHCTCVSVRSTKEVRRENDRPRGIPGQEQHGDVHPVENPESNDTEDVLNCEITPAQSDLDLAQKP
jgi:hypothetical protein